MTEYFVGLPRRERDEIAKPFADAIATALAVAFPEHDIGVGLLLKGDDIVIGQIHRLDGGPGEPSLAARIDRTDPVATAIAGWIEQNLVLIETQLTRTGMLH